jgi:hypothetical protein
MEGIWRGSAMAKGSRLAPSSMPAGPAGCHWRRRVLCLPKSQHTIMLMLALLASISVWAMSPAEAAAISATCPNEAVRTSPSNQLPDCRAYEQVSPVEKLGFAGATQSYPAQAAPNGEALMYMSFSSFSGALSSSLPDAYIATRSATGWQTSNVSPPTPEATPPGGDPVGYDFSSNLSQWVVGLPWQPLAPGATPGVVNLFLTNGDSKYSWINDVRPTVVPPEGCPGFILTYCYEVEDFTAFAGASADESHVLFESSDSLASGAPEGLENLYESNEVAGIRQVSLAGILPNGGPAQGSTAGAGSSAFYTTIEREPDSRVAGAISEDGSRVIFNAPAEGEPDPAQGGLPEVYDRIDGRETIELSAPAPGATPAITTPEKARFWAASANGDRVFFTSKAELTTPSYTGATAAKGEDLYEYDLKTKTLTDLTIDTNLPADEVEGAAVQGVLGTSSDGSYVYFVAKGQLVPGTGVDHEDNLYMVHNGGAPVFIATLNAQDSKDWTTTPVELESYVTADGKHVAFTSINPLATKNFPSGYDNVNESTGNAEREVYEYAAPNTEEELHGSSGSLVCASCDPSGAQPIGPGVIAGGGGPGQSSVNTPFHQVRAVSENGGRVFFTSQDPLVAAAAGNKQPKVYEYEQDQEGSCEAAPGCVELLSSPSGSASFLDSDGDGNNVFIATASQLTASDQDSLVDVYDVRVDGGLAGPPRTAFCKMDCRETAAEPPGPAPLSGSASASGNLRPPSAEKAKKTPAQVRAEKLTSALRACHQKRNRRKRRSCITRARRRYAPRQKAKKSSHSSMGRGKQS